MNHETLVPDVIRALYEGSSEIDQACLSDVLLFSDPLVRVRGSAKVVRMFGRLSGFFAATEIKVFAFEEADEQSSTWAMEVHYKRSPKAKPKIFKSTVVVTGTAERIESITEHWHKPMSLRGGSKGLVPRPMRAMLGWMFS
jgi:hypothetical protein